MIEIFCFVIGCAVTLAISQSPISVSGTVRDSRKATPIAGATVKLQSQALSAITDTTGAFTVSGTSELAKPETRTGFIPCVDPATLAFFQAEAGPARVRILDLSGQARAEIFSGRLAQGHWRVTPPSLAPGIYFCAFATPRGQQTVRFLAAAETFSTVTAMLQGAEVTAGSVRDGSVRDGSVKDGTAKSSDRAIEAAGSLKAAVAAATAAAPVDTLIVSKNGYRPARVPLAAYQQSGLSILLEDTATTAGSDNATLVPDPSWTCFMPDGIPPPSLGTAAFIITLQIGAIHDVGLTKFGQRRQYDIKGGTVKDGTVTGANINATAMTGGLDYELTLSNGSMEIEQINILQVGTTPILMRNAGVAAAGDKNARVVLDFEAPNSSSYTRLNTGKYAAMRVVDTVAKTIRMEVYDISKATLPSARVQITDPAGVPNQTWDCFKLTGSQGATVFTENVTLGTSVSIGASKRGSRNIIPITGGTTTGKVAGKILNGGADYQLGGLDARYTLSPSDGEFIIVRNCGANGLVPVFEARVAGPYNFLNENKYLSSQPNTGSGGVSITFYEAK